MVSYSLRSGARDETGHWAQLQHFEGLIGHFDNNSCWCNCGTAHRREIDIHSVDFAPAV
jgi:hypothetical protein